MRENRISLAKFCFALVFLIVSYTPKSAFALYDPAIEMQQSIGVVRARIQLLRIKIAQIGSTELKAADSHVTFLVDDSPLPIAYENDGVIHISNGFHVLLLYIEDVGVYTAEHNEFQMCGSDYNSYLQKTLAENRWRYLHNQPLEEMRAPEAFIALGYSDCRGYENVFPLPMSAREERDTRLQHMLDIVYLHELGHYALHHSVLSEQTLRGALGGSADPKVLNELARSRNQEFQADAWGLKQFIETFGMTPNIALYDLLNLLLINGNGFNCSGDTSSTHPDGLERFVALSPQLRAWYNDRLVGDARKQFNALLDDMIAFSAKVQRVLHC